jgi:hypothetical protein
LPLGVADEGTPTVESVRDPSRVGGAWTWRPAAAWYFALSLAGLAAGLWPGAIFFPRSLVGGALPALQSLGVAQVAFFLLAYPLIVSRRASKPSPMPKRVWLPCALESGLLLAATAPLYAAAAWVSDAVWGDCLRSALAVACLCPLSWAAGRGLAAARGSSPGRGPATGQESAGGDLPAEKRSPVAGRGSSAILICLLLAAIGLPWAQYVCRDFAAADRAADVLWRISPATFVWDAAASRQPAWWPQPAWVIAIWVALAAGLAALPTGGGSHSNPKAEPFEPMTGTMPAHRRRRSGPRWKR